jgi:hypothetical protein
MKERIITALFWIAAIAVVYLSAFSYLYRGKSGS